MTIDHSTLSTIPKLIARVLELEEVDAKATFERANLDYTDLIKTADRVPMEKMYALWEQAVIATENPSFGLLAASVFQPAYLKGIGLAWIASETLGKGLERFINNIGMVNTAVKIDLSTQGEEVILKYLAAEGAAPDTIKAHPCAIQLGLGFLLRMFRLAASRPVPVSKVYFKHPVSDAEKPDYETFFQCPIIDQHTFNGVAFETAVLNEPLPAADEALASLNDQAIREYMRSLEQSSLAQKVSECIAPILASGCPTENEIAVRMHMSKRTLQRKLSAEGSSYGKLLSSLRSDLAKTYLRNSTLPITEIAYQLGYSSPSTFARAFKQSIGLTPNEFREHAPATNNVS